MLLWFYCEGMPQNIESKSNLLKSPSKYKQILSTLSVNYPAYGQLIRFNPFNPFHP